MMDVSRPKIEKYTVAWEIKPVLCRSSGCRRCGHAPNEWR